ncbi:hypothetical protein [Shewanella algae]|uniref:hypothetical protein n=1 Tax=Shewanella algae TaxID=38313 RepID=UPI0012DE529F|nr:hypothetical protein [Shewanella algae]MBO2668108.1 hypothetical protein [Shewanella algae]QGS58634.1 hypothetical protein GMX02_03380 [Shewanella algae]
MEIGSPLVQLALLESLKTNEISDEIDLFLPFIAVTLSDLDKLEITPEILQNELGNSFGFKPPISAIKVFITRAKKRKLLHRENNTFIPNIEIVNQWKNGYHEKKEDISVSLELLRRDFIEFSKNKFNKELSPKDCDILIEQFIYKNIASVSDATAFEKNELKEKLKNTDHVTASFISYIHKNKTSSLDHFSRIVKGMLLANYLCFADKIGTKKNYNSLTVYLDTPIIVGLLGFSGLLKKKSLNEFIVLLKNVNINLCVFDKTLDEAEQLLAAWKDDLARKNYKRFNTKTLELLRHLGYDSARLDTEIKLLKSSLENMEIVVKYGFKPKRQFQCDEIALEKAISTNFKESKNLEHDTVCISRIYNMREGKLVSDLDKSFSVFVTPNTGLVTTANKFFEEEIPKKTIPLIVSEQWMTTMFWLKKPELFGNLPMEQIISSAYGLLYTDDKFWKSFITKLELLEKRKQITEEDLIQVRWDSDLLRMVHDVSVEVGENFTDEDVFEIVEAIKKKHIEQKESEISKLQEDINSKDYKLEVTRLRHKKIANSVSFVPALLLSILLAGLILWVALLALPKELLPQYIKPEYQKFGINTSAIMIVFVLNILGGFFGVNLLTIYRHSKRFLYQKIFRILQGE